jgi:hypothetical protein
MEAASGLIPSVVLDVYRVVHGAASNVIARGEAHGPMLVSVRFNGEMKVSLIDELPKERWRDTLHEVAEQRGIMLACLISEATVFKYPTEWVALADLKQDALIFNFVEGANHQEYMAICEIDRTRASLTMGQVDPVIRDG